MSIRHETLQFTHTVPAPIETVWAAIAEVDHRRQWGVPAGEVVHYDEADFSPGGRDVYRCGPAGDLSITGTHTYHVIEAPRLLIYSDAVEKDAHVLATALLTWQLQPDPPGTVITVTDQLTSLVGRGMVAGHRNGHEKTLSQLVRYLS